MPPWFWFALGAFFGLLYVVALFLLSRYFK